jgi:hypothetical protein
MAKYSTRKNPHGLILLSDLDHSGSSGGFNVHGVFSADFRNYITYFALSNDRDSNQLTMSLKDSPNNADNTNGNYRYAFDGWYSSNSEVHHETASEDRFKTPVIGGGDTNTAERRSITLSGTIQWMNPQTVSNHCHLIINMQAKNDSDVLYAMSGCWEYKTAGNQIYGFGVSPSANYLNTYNFKTYGIPESMSE